MKLIIYAIPVFLLLITAEVLLTRLLERPWYRLADSINDLSCGILDQVLEVFLKAALFAGYIWTFEHHRLFEISGGAAWAWVACFVGVDFLYYWFHRMSHEVNAFWAAHVVHHQSEEFNLSVALRQGALQGGFSWTFYLPLALLGFPPAMFLTLSSINTLYQFWIHTRAIKTLGPLEWVFNTPSHHRVHHGRNPKYIDRNHAGTLIIWDRMFGTFQQEEEEPMYGITTPLRSWNPLWANTHYWVEIFDKARRASRVADRLRFLVKPPGWQPEEMGGFLKAPEVDPEHVTYDSPAPAGVKAYVAVQFLLLLLGTSLYLFQQDALALPGQSAGALAVVASLVALGGLLDQKPWAFVLEVGRVLLLAAGAAGLSAQGVLPVWAGAAVAAAAVGLLGWLAVVRVSAPAVPALVREN